MVGCGTWGIKPKILWGYDVRLGIDHGSIWEMFIFHIFHTTMRSFKIFGSVRWGISPELWQVNGEADDSPSDDLGMKPATWDTNFWAIKIMGYMEQGPEKERSWIDLR